MSEKPTYQELEQRIKELEEESVKRKQAEKALRRHEHIISATGDHMSFLGTMYIKQ